MSDSALDDVERRGLFKAKPESRTEPIVVCALHSLQTDTRVSFFPNAIPEGRRCQAALAGQRAVSATRSRHTVADMEGMIHLPKF